MTRQDELRNMVKCAVSGPWDVDGPVWNRVVWSSPSNRVCFMAHSNGCNDDQDMANSRLCAAAPTLATDLADALDEVARLRAAPAHADIATLRECAEKAEAQNRELAMQSLAHLGQAQEAYEAQKKAEAERDRLAAELAEARAVLLDGSRPLPFNREDAGRMVREAWVRWAETQPNPKPSWLVPYHELSEADKEADRQIGETVARWTLAFDASRAALTTETPT